MYFELTDDEAHTLRALLTDYLPELKMEVARTDAREFRHEMVKRQEVCERLLGLLDKSGA